jgi:hypothetical protein
MECYGYAAPELGGKIYLIDIHLRPRAIAIFNAGARKGSEERSFGNWPWT